MNVLRRIPLSRLLLLCGAIVAAGIAATALALAVGAGPTPPPKPLAEAIHDALSAQRVSGVSARIQYANHLLEGSDLASSGGESGKLSSNPLLSGASGRLWVASDGRARLELQSEKGDTQILYDGHTVSLYDASTNTLYRYTPPQEPGGSAPPRGSEGAAGAEDLHNTPTTKQIQDRIDRLARHAVVSGATPTDIAGQPAYTVRIAPRETGSLIAGAEFSWDAVHGIPLRAAVYSTASSAPAVELAVTDISYGAPPASVFEFQPPADAKVQEVKLPAHGAGASGQGGKQNQRPHVTLHGKGLTAIAVAESQAKPGEKTPSQLEGLPKVDVGGASAALLQTELGTLLSFQRAGVRYLLAGSVAPATIEALARSLSR